MERDVEDRVVFLSATEAGDRRMRQQLRSTLEAREEVSECLIRSTGQEDEPQRLGIRGQSLLQRTIEACVVEGGMSGDEVRVRSSKAEAVDGNEHGIQRSCASDGTHAAVSQSREREVRLMVVQVGRNPLPLQHDDRLGPTFDS